MAYSNRYLYLNAPVHQRYVIFIPHMSTRTKNTETNTKITVSPPFPTKFKLDSDVILW